MKKLVLICLLLMIAMFGIISCSLNKDIIKKSESEYTTHILHSGKYGKCSLCANQLQAKKSNDSVLTPLSVQKEDGKQLFASNSEQEILLLKSSKYILQDSFENSILIRKEESKNILNKINNNSKKYSKPKSIKSYIKNFLISLLIIAIIFALLGFAGTVLSVIWSTILFLLPIYIIVKFLKLLFQAIKETPKERKKYWYLLPILIIPVLFMMLVLLPFLVVLSPFAIVYVAIKLIKSRNKKKSAAQKLGIFTLIIILLGLLALLIFVPWFTTLIF